MRGAAAIDESIADDRKFIRLNDALLPGKSIVDGECGWPADILNSGVAVDRRKIGADVFIDDAGLPESMVRDLPCDELTSEARRADERSRLLFVTYDRRKTRVQILIGAADTDRAIGDPRMIRVDTLQRELQRAVGLLE
jgi:hypothetical protein